MTDNQPACAPEITERARAESLSLFPARMRDGHAYHATADVLDKCVAAIERLLAENERMREALAALAGIKAEDGDDFSSYPDEAVIRCEITAGDIHCARAALVQKGKP